MILAAVGQPLAQGGVESRWPGVIRQRGQLGGGCPHRIDQQPAGGCQPGQRVFVAWILGDRLERGSLGVIESLVRNIEIGQQHDKPAHNGDSSPGPVRLWLDLPPAGSLEIGPAQRHQHFGRERVDLLGAGQLP